MTEVPLYWWAPSRSASLVRAELRTAGHAWARLTYESPRVPSNFGDELSPVVVAAVLGETVKWASRSSARLLGIGSILELYAWRGEGAAVWGSGLRAALTNSDANSVRRRLGPVFAVRGPLTRDALGLPPDTVLGDPGLLASRLVEPRVVSGGKLVVPHFRAWSERSSRGTIKALQARGYELVHPNEAPLRVLARIADASFVATSSLHALIAAHALNVPAVLVRFAGSVRGESSFKYDDYHASIGTTAVWADAEGLLASSTERRLTRDAEYISAELLAGSRALAEPLEQALLRGWSEWR